jgi:deoxyhypusine synthase
MQRGPISQFIEKNYLHFNAAALVDAAKGYETHLAEGGKMMVTLAGAMSTAELGISLAEMIRQDKVQIISCTGANLEEDIMNLVAHSHYKRVPNYRDLSPQDEWDLLEGGFNRVTDTCIPEEEAFRRIQKHIFKQWKNAQDAGERYLPHEYMYKMLLSKEMEQYYERTHGCWRQQRRTSRSFVRDGKTPQWATSLPPIASRVSLFRPR